MSSTSAEVFNKRGHDTYVLLRAIRPMDQEKAFKVVLKNVLRRCPIASLRADSELMLLIRLTPASYRFASAENKDETRAVADPE